MVITVACINQNQLALLFRTTHKPGTTGIGMNTIHASKTPDILYQHVLHSSYFPDFILIEGCDINIYIYKLQSFLHLKFICFVITQGKWLPVLPITKWLVSTLKKYTM